MRGQMHLKQSKIFFISKHIAQKLKLRVDDSERENKVLEMSVIKRTGTEIMYLKKNTKSNETLLWKLRIWQLKYFDYIKMYNIIMKIIPEEKLKKKKRARLITILVGGQHHKMDGIQLGQVNPKVTWSI